MQRRKKIPIKKKKKKKVCLLKFRKWWSSWSQKAVTFSSAIRCCAISTPPQLTSSGPSLTAVIAVKIGIAHTWSHLTSAAPGSYHCPSRASLLPPRETPVRTESIILKLYPVYTQWSENSPCTGQPLTNPDRAVISSQVDSTRSLRVLQAGQPWCQW